MFHGCMTQNLARHAAVAAAAVLCVGVRIVEDTASIIILTSLVILSARAGVGEHDTPNAPDNHRRFGIGVAIFLLIFVG